MFNIDEELDNLEIELEMLDDEIIAIEREFPDFEDRNDWNDLMTEASNIEDQIADLESQLYDQ